MCEETAALGGLWQSVLGRFYGHQTSKANQTTCDPSCAQNQCSYNYLVTPMPYFVARFVNEMDQPRLKAIIAPFSATHCSHQHHNLGARVPPFESLPPALGFGRTMCGECDAFCLSCDVIHVEDSLPASVSCF